MQRIHLLFNLCASLRFLLIDDGKQDEEDDQSRGQQFAEREQMHIAPVCIEQKVFVGIIQHGQRAHAGEQARPSADNPMQRR